MIRQAIQTKYFGPTNTRGSRIVAQCAAKRVSVPYEHSMSAEENHLAAAYHLQVALGWVGERYGELRTGTLADGSYVHVLVITE
jgi:hypothetical protein